MDIPLLGGDAAGSQLENNCPLRGCAFPNHHKLHRQLTNISALCGSSEEEGFTSLAILVGPANQLGLGAEGGPLAPSQQGRGPVANDDTEDNKLDEL